MASRTIYSCDWCRDEAPEPNSKGLGHGWRHNGNELLCVDCVQAIEDSLAATKAQRSGLTKGPTR